MWTALSLALLLASGANAPSSDVPAAKAPQATSPAAREARPNERVGGDLEAQVGREGESWRSGRQFTEAPLPVGYPAPTPVGSIEIKRYPSVRRAEISGKGSVRGASQQGFYPLFNHIKNNDIAMTAPVEMDLPGWSATDDRAPESWTMSFLYRVPELRETGQDGRVTVRDTQPVTVLSIGTTGNSGVASMRDELASLEAWLAGQGRWKAVGAPRWLAYNGPYIPAQRRWCEVQIPIAVALPGAASSAEASNGSGPAGTSSGGSGSQRGPTPPARR